MDKTQAQLDAEGWKLASITAGDQLKRILEMYSELGIAVYLREVKPEECGQCLECYKERNESLYRVYTRPIT